MKIAVLGIGNIGKLLAHSLARKPNPPSITLLLHRPDLAEEYKKSGQSIEIITNNISNTQSSFFTEILTDDHDITFSKESIRNLIVATKAVDTVSALGRIKNRLDQQSTILFTQNGLGLIEEVTEYLFPNVKTRPSYLASVISHGVYKRSSFSSVHAGFGTMSIGRVTSTQNGGACKSSDDLLDEAHSQGLLEQMINSSTLAATEIPPTELIQAQIEKLIVNAIINPLSAIFHRKNGQLFNHPAIAHVMQLLLSEASLVARSLPELQPLPNTNSRFSMHRLEHVVRDVAAKTETNTSSMLQDVLAGRETEIDYINGYIIGRGAQLQISCPHHRRVVQMVKDRRFVTEEQVGEIFTLGGD